ncbi:type I polyketide synthase [Actinokineospora diospyrosa]|uniref:Acyl transferase domain-containing protein n=1 Tax=Actinokineospora diospyrosa TaxID=103728 RepID=A0ABT1IH30_9PSEU|nr:type I polyketide synthase [Actinokineospora diospyrosa]MCP2271576.1 Acyl transferase domain-containing protein [Actinokineospora diospyrosa]
MDPEIAVVGMAGRFPGAVDLDEYWSTIVAGRVGLTRMTRDDLLAAGVSGDVVDAPSYVPVRGVLTDPEYFDSEFFGIPPREADIMDPQHRLLLQTAWDALESGGLTTNQAFGRVGVFAGAGYNYYLQQQVLARPDIVSAHGLLSIVLGNEKDHLATRIAYRLGLHGPAITVQTGCSTSLVAVHLACQSLRAGDTDVALAGGVYTAFPRLSGYVYEPKGIMSPDGSCRPFDTTANGTVPGSGVGVVALKRLADARRDGDLVHAVISGSAINNDGAGKVGYTAPGVAGQIDVLTRAYESAGVDPGTVGYLEAHGTATEVGDAIELAALGEVFTGTATCSLGSVKANIGHASAAAGVAGLIKVVLALRERRIPPLAGLKEPREELRGSPFTVDGVARDWVAGAQPRRAAVSSFGLGGTNVHMVVSEAEPVESTTAPGSGVVVVSARTEEALRAAAERLAAHLRGKPELALPDVAFTSQEHRRHFTHRIAVAASDAAGAAEALDVARGHTVQRRPNVVFLFPGQGAEAPGMAEWPYRHYPSFAADIDEGCAHLRDLLGLDLRDLLVGRDEHGLIHRTDVTQPALVLHEYALGRLLRSWGVRPAALIGHSVGEFAAACLAGELTLADTMRLVVERGALMQRAPEGGMVVVLAPEPVVRDHLADLDGLGIASVNAPEVVVVSGSTDALAVLRERLTGAGVTHRVLPAQRAFHSWMMAEAATGLDAVAATVEQHASSVEVISSVTGQVLPKGGRRPSGYWAEQLRSPVRYQDAIETAAGLGRVVFVEVGPGTGLIGSARQIPAAREAATVAVQPRRGDLLSGAGGLWSAGIDLDWSAVRVADGVQVPLPTYPFTRTRHWLDSAPQPHPAQPDPVPVEPVVTDAPGSVLGQVIDLWRSMLGVATIEAGSDFFTLGGESLLFLRMISQVQRRFGVSVEIAELAAAPTPAAIAAQVERA